MGAHRSCVRWVCLKGSTAPAGARYVGIHQAVLGEVDYKSDTRVSGAACGDRSERRELVDDGPPRRFARRGWATSTLVRPMPDRRRPRAGSPVRRQARAAKARPPASRRSRRDWSGRRSSSRGRRHASRPMFRCGESGGWRFQIGADGAVLSSSRGHVERTRPCASNPAVATRCRCSTTGTPSKRSSTASCCSSVRGGRRPRRTRRRLRARRRRRRSCGPLEAHPRAVEIAAAADAPRPWTAIGRSSSTSATSLVRPARSTNPPATAGHAVTRLSRTGVFER